MSPRSTLIYVLAMTLAVSPVMAQPQQADPDKWRAFAEQLPPNALVAVHLTSGERVEGQVVQVTADALHLNPQTRIPVSVRVIAFDTIQSIDREKGGMSTGVKVAIWTTVAIGLSIAFGYLIVLSSGK